MSRKTFTLTVMFVLISGVAALAQEAQPGTPKLVPAASRSRADCTGFFAAPSLSDRLVVGGGDDDFHSAARAFIKGESVYLSSRATPDFAVGSLYSVVRKADYIFNTSRYSGQGSTLRGLGRPYEDEGRVRVTHVVPNGAVATVEFSCGPILPGDIAIPYEPRSIPEYAVTPPLDPFTPLDSSKRHGIIAAAINNYGYFGQDTVVYLNLGQADGAQPGQRFRVYKSKEALSETVGEAVVLSVQPKSCVAIMVETSREVYAGDGVEEE